jgi:hypothetical protein
VLKIDRTAPPQPAPGGDSDQEEGEASGLVITEDATIYSKEEIQQLLETLTAGNGGGVVRVEPLFYGIAGEFGPSSKLGAAHARRLPQVSYASRPPTT